MSSPDFYYTIDKTSIAEFKDRGSRFIGYAYAIEKVNDFKEKLAEIKKEHPKATHHCFAYRLGLDSFNYRVSDNGEPSGTAGKPILGQIDSKQLTNVLVIVVRYYGGTLLGVPGLINAYKTAAALALQTTPVVQKPVTVNYNLQFDYTQMSTVMNLIRQYNCEILKQDMQLFCSMDIAVSKSRQDEIIYKLNDTRVVTVTKL